MNDMTVRALIDYLKNLPDHDLRIAFVDDSCITQPVNGLPHLEHISEDDASNHGGFEGRVGELVVMFSV